MIYEIGPNCITCGRCEANCPVHCIFPGSTHYEIRGEQCVGCKTCVTLCPMDAIHSSTVQVHKNILTERGTR